MGDAVSRFDEEALEKVTTPALVHDCTTPDIADDDDGAEGHYVAVVGNPNAGDVPSWSAADRKYYPLPSSGGFTPTYIGPSETFTVPANRQAFYVMDIDNEGTLNIEGFLIQVD